MSGLYTDDPLGPPMEVQDEYVNYVPQRSYEPTPDCETVFGIDPLNTDVLRLETLDII